MLLLGSDSYEAQLDARGQRLIWLETALINRPRGYARTPARATAM